MGVAFSLACTHFLGCHGPLPQKDPGLLRSPHVEPGTVLQTSALTHYCGASGTACPHPEGFIAPAGGSAERNPLLPGEKGCLGEDWLPYRITAGLRAWGSLSRSRGVGSRR